MRDEDEGDGSDAAGGQRLDRWLWFARILKSRTSASAAVSDGRVRVNRVRIARPAHAVKPGDVLTIALRQKVLVLRVLATGTRRGPPKEAHGLYEDVSGAARADKGRGAGK